MLKGVRTSLAHYSAPFRRVGASALVRYLVIAIGLVAMTVFTVAERRNSVGIWLSVCLWCCWAYFLAESAFHFGAAIRGGTARRELVSLSGLVEFAGVLPVPIALACGVAPPTA